MAYLTLGDLDPFEMVEATARGGFEATALRLTGHSPGDDWGFDPTNAADIRRMARLSRDAGISLVNISTYRFVPGAAPADFRPVIDACAELGIGMITANSFAGEEAEVTALMAEIARDAASRNIRLGIEFIPVSRIRTAADALRIARATDAGNVGLVVDALHLWRSGGTVETVRGLPGDRIFALQLCDAPLAAPDDLAAEMRSARLLPGDGEFDLRGLVDAVPAATEIEIEVPNADYDRLTPTARARLVHDAGEAFLARAHAD